MMCYKKISRYCLALPMVCLGTSGFSNVALSRPALVEFFGQNSCSGDLLIQESLQKILLSEEDVIVINCRTWSDREGTAATFSHQFCNERHDLYQKHFKRMNLYHISPVIVNGRWDANHQDILPAVKIGRTDNLESISMKIHDNMLDISVPKLASAVGSGDIVLYAYMPTQGGEKSVYVDPDVSLTDEMKERINANKSVPFVTKLRADPLYVRPVLSMEKIGHWTGEKIDMTVSLSSLTALAASGSPDLSYVVVLYEGGDFGPVLAVGEIVSLTEFNNTLPHSEPQDIKYVSPPKL